jgi:hypothetical protein
MDNVTSEIRLTLGELKAMTFSHEDIKLWCQRHGLVVTVEDRELPARLPYRADQDPQYVLVARSFLVMEKGRSVPVPVEPMPRNVLRHREAASPSCSCGGTGDRLFQGTWITCECITGR